MPALNLTQIDGFTPPGEFRDSAGTTWTLVKSASSGMGEIPDPAAINITDYWNHEYPGSGGKVFLYVVEGIRLPKTQRETACRVLYAWFSTIGEKSFTPQMIRPGEWLTANVYAAGITDARVSKLHAICKTKPEAERPREPAGDNTPPPLIKMEDLINDRSAAGADGRNAPDNPGERRKNNR
jgi:hypothetical protein